MHAENAPLSFQAHAEARPPKGHNVIEELPKAFANKFPKWESSIEPVDLQ